MGPVVSGRLLLVLSLLLSLHTSRGRAEITFGDPEGAHRSLVDSSQANLPLEHAILERAAKVWLKKGPVSWGARDKESRCDQTDAIKLRDCKHIISYSAFPWWNNVSDITVTYPNGPPEDPKRNRDKPGDFKEGMELWPYVAERVKHVRGRAPVVWLLCDICRLLELGHPLDREWVLLTDMGDNWGILSQTIKVDGVRRSADWGGVANQVKDCGKTLDDVREYLDDPRLLMMVITQHQHPPIANHPKVLPVPLGIPGDHPLAVAPWLFSRLIKEKRYQKLHRTTYFNTANSGFEFRKQINDVLAVNFPLSQFGPPPEPQRFKSACCGNVFSFCFDSKPRMPWGCEKFVPYMDALLQSRFVLCLPGMGMDTYRHMEALYSGAIPVFESANGALNATYQDLPVLVVESFASLTPAKLQEAYTDIMSNLDRFNWERLSYQWYFDQIREASGRGREWSDARSKDADVAGDSARGASTSQLTSFAKEHELQAALKAANARVAALEETLAHINGLAVAVAA